MVETVSRECSLRISEQSIGIDIEDVATSCFIVIVTHRHACLNEAALLASGVAPSRIGKRVQE